MSFTFPPQLKIGQEFEQSVKHLLEKKGFVVSLNTSKDLAELRKYDLITEKDNRPFSVGVKLDVMSQKTGNVCIEIGALEHSQSQGFNIGLPQDYWVDMYFMPLLEILCFAQDYPFKKTVGQWHVESSLIPKERFANLPFVKRLSINPPLH